METKITDIQMKIIINTNLYKKEVIDKNTFSLVNEKLLRMLKTFNPA